MAAKADELTGTQSGGFYLGIGGCQRFRAHAVLLGNAEQRLTGLHLVGLHSAAGGGSGCSRRGRLPALNLQFLAGADDRAHLQSVGFGQSAGAGVGLAGNPLQAVACLDRVGGAGRLRRFGRRRRGCRAVTRAEPVVGCFKILDLALLLQAQRAERFQLGLGHGDRRGNHHGQRGEKQG